MQMPFCLQPHKHHCIFTKQMHVCDLQQASSWSEVSGRGCNSLNQHVLLILILGMPAFVQDTMFYLLYSSCKMTFGEGVPKLMH